MPILSEITGKMRNADLSEEERNKYMNEYAEFQNGPVWGGWREAEVKEIRSMLEAACA
jgi:hypothetical protein